jgi:hypothetical protein
MVRALSDAVLRVCLGAGAIGGLLWGLHHQAHPTCQAARYPRHHHHHIHALGADITHCVGHSLNALITRWGLALGGGILLGLLAGVLAVLLLRGLKAALA